MTVSGNVSDGVMVDSHLCFSEHSRNHS